MKILHVITSLRSGGAEKLMIDLLPRLRDLGNDVELLLFDGTKTPFYEELEKTGIKIHHLSIGGNVYNPLNIIQLIKYIRQFDIIHTHNTACQYFVPLAKILSRAICKLFTTEHSTNNRRRQYKFFKYIDKFIYSRYKFIISISEKATNSLAHFVGNKDNITTVENGIDLSKFRKFKAPILDDTKKIITMVAGFRDAKDQDTLIRAIALLPREYKLWLIGDGERRNVLENLAAELNITDRVKFWGVQSNIPFILEQSHIVVLSSHWEGFGLAAVEAMSASRPVIASNVDGLREVVKDAGILFPHQDFQTLALEIRSICKNQSKYNKVALACKEKANQYDINIMATKYNNLYSLNV